MALQDPSTELVVAEAPAPVEPTETGIRSLLDPPTPERQAELERKAKAYVADFGTFNPNGPGADGKLAELRSLGSSAVDRTTAGGSALLQRSIAQMRQSGGPTEEIGKSILNLRKTVSELTPRQAGLKAGIFGSLKRRAVNYVSKYDSAQGTLDAIMRSLDDGKTALQKDSAAIQVEKTNLWASMGELNEWIIMADALRHELEAKAAQLDSDGQKANAHAIRTTLLNETVTRALDLRTQLTVALQGFQSLSMAQSNNAELIKGVDRVKSTTMMALRNAVLTAQALATQKQVLEQLSAVQEVTEGAIRATDQLMAENSVAIAQAASKPAVAIEVLEASFTSLFDTMDKLDEFRISANSEKSKSIEQLDRVLANGAERLRRSADAEAAISATAARPALSL